MRILTLLALIFILAFISSAISCSRSGVPTEPSLEDQNLPSGSVESTGNRQVIGVYDAVIDPVSQTFTVTPERNSTFHFPLSNSFANSLSITGFGWTPTFWADIKITHPFPGSGIAVFDPRVIAIIPAAAGFSFNYPALGAIGNNSVVYQPDGYTKLFDNLGGSIPGNVNPFKAYMKTMPYRVWLSTGSKTSETQRWYMNLAGFGGPATYKLVLDVSTNYPAPPHQITDNAPEPVQARVQIDPGLTSLGGEAYGYIYLTDWQGDSSIQNALLEAPQLFNGYIGFAYNGAGPGPNEYTYWSWVNNELVAPVGTYKAMCASSDTATGITLYHETSIEVKPPYPDNPRDYTIPKINWTPEDMVLINGYSLFTASGVNGINCFSLTDYSFLWWTNSNALPGSDIRTLKYIENYLYALDVTNNRLQVVIGDPNYMVNTANVALPGRPYDIDFSTNGDYAFIACGSAGVQVIDIRTPDTSHIESSLTTPGSARGVCISGNFLYVADYSGGLQIAWIDPPTTPYIMKNVAIPANAIKVAAQGDYAYVLDESVSMHVIDVIPFDQATLIKSVTFPDNPMDITVFGNYAYVADNMYNLEVVDITTPSNAYRVVGRNTPIWGKSILKDGNFVLVADNLAGIDSYNVSTPSNPTLIGSFRTPGGARDVLWKDIYVYLAADYEGFEIMEGYPGQPHGAMSKWNYYPAPKVMGFDVQGDYAVIGCGASGIAIYDIYPPGSETLVKTLPTSGFSAEVDISGSYAYVADGASGLTIVKIDIPESSYVVKTVDTPYSAVDVCVSGNYAYVADLNSGLQIININPPTSASLVKSVAMPDQAMGVAYANGYAYVGANTAGLVIVDVDPVNSSSITKTVDTPGTAYGVYMYGDFAFVADGSSGLQNIKINPVADAAIYSAVDTPGTAYDVFVEDWFALVADDRGGMRIIKLW